MRHIPACVKKNGPLFAYSNYPMEDMIGHIVSKVHGTTDVLLQITDRYLLEKNLEYNVKASPAAAAYFDRVNIAKYRDKRLMCSNLIEEEKRHIVNKYGPNFVEYQSKLINGDYYEVRDLTKKKKTCDSFAITKNRLFGHIRSIFIVNGGTFLLLLNEYNTTDDLLSHSIRFLTPRAYSYYFTISSSDLGKKAVFMETNDIVAYSTLPNNCERD